MYKRQEQDYEFTFGITRKEFAQMLEALNAAYCKEHRRRPHFTKIKMCIRDSVKAGDVLVILEARKMENEIVAPQDGTVASINVNKGDTVNSGDGLVSMN